MSNIATFNNLEEMEAWVLARPNYDVRFILKDRPMWKKGDKVGKYYLADSVRYISLSIIELSSEFGEQLYKAWPKKPAYKGSSHLVPNGARTLAGVLKLLDSDATKKIKAAKDTKKSEDEKKRRNSYRRAIKDKLAAVSLAIKEGNEIGLRMPDLNFRALMPFLEEEK